MIVKVEHTAIIVKDIDQSLEFYCNHFGFVLRDRGNIPNKEIAFIYHKNQPSFEIELIRELTPVTEYSKSGIVNHIAFTVDNIDEAMNYFKAQGIQFNSDQPNKSLDGGRNIFFYGPSGELLQLIEPSPARKGKQLNS